MGSVQGGGVLQTAMRGAPDCPLKSSLPFKLGDPPLLGGATWCWKEHGREASRRVAGLMFTSNVVFLKWLLVFFFHPLG